MSLDYAGSSKLNNESKYIRFFLSISNYDLKKDKRKPLKAIDTLNTLKLLQMMYKSSEKKSCHITVIFTIVL